MRGPSPRCLGRSLIFAETGRCYRAAVTWRQLALKTFIVSYLLLQVGVPVFGLYVRSTVDASGIRYSWQMYSAPLPPSDAAR